MYLNTSSSRQCLTSSIIVFAITILLVRPFELTAATIRIPKDHKTIQAGIDAATVGDVVLLHKGVHPPRSLLFDDELRFGEFNRGHWRTRAELILITDEGADTFSVFWVFRSDHPFFLLKKKKQFKTKLF